MYRSGRTEITCRRGPWLMLWPCIALMQVPTYAAEATYSPYVDQSYPTNVYWGDTHVHTNLSADAAFTLGQDEAYRFARGETVTSIGGQPVRLKRPLDFLVIAEHGKNMGAQFVRNRVKADAAFRHSKLARLWRQIQQELLEVPGADASRIRDGSLWPRSLQDIAISNVEFRQSIWTQLTARADRYNDPGRFTAFIGYEYTPFTPPIHRVVIFRDDAARASKVLPFTAFDSERPEDLWRYLADYEARTGGAALAIPHNGNLTFGRMFEEVNSEGLPITRDYAVDRSHWEPLVEVTQTKGDSETHPVVSPDDEFADYETWNGWAGRQNGGIDSRGRKLQVRPESKIKNEYARPALKLGLRQQALTGVNPFKFGMIGSTDTHMALPGAVDENNFWAYEPSAARVTTTFSATTNWEMNAAGLAAVWATGNTRKDLFNAMRRKEVYASTGPRMTVRFFGGWDYVPADATRPDLARVGYTNGVPMGSDLTNAPEGKSPRFLIRAVKDPDGANLDRMQVIKGWRDTSGELHEKVYNVALSDGRKVDASGHVEPLVSTVNIKEASYTNSVGEPELAVVWEDPDFDKNELAFYYVRVLEIPTPRWTAYDAKFYVAKLYSVDSLAKEMPMVTQERAYTSPIWFTP